MIISNYPQWNVREISKEKQGNEFIFSENLELKVNGELITAQDVEKQYDLIPPENKKNITRNLVLESLISQKIMLQEASQKGVTATDKEVDQYLDKVRSFTKLNETSLEEEIVASGSTLKEYRKSVKELLTLSKLLEKELNLKNVKASDADVNDYIQKNREGYQDFFDENDPELEDMLQNRIKAQLTQEKQQALVNDYLESLKQKAKIEAGGGV